MSKTVLTYSYSQAKNGYIVSGYESIADDGEVIIPDRGVGEEGNLKVFGIGNRAFAGCNEITSIVIPNFITEIGGYAFEGCEKLVKAVIDCNIPTLKAGIFSGCTSLSIINIPNSVTQIEENAFQNCSAMKSIIIPDNVISVGAQAFYNCTYLASVIIGNSVTNIDNSAFSGCTSLTSVTIPGSVTSIDSGAFSGCTGLTSITIPNSVTNIGLFAFSGCTSLTIYCEAASKPFGWIGYWNISNCPVEWGFTDRGLINDNVIWIEHKEKIKIIGYQGQPRIITLPEKINGQSVECVRGFAQCNANLVNIHCNVAAIESNAFDSSDNVTFRYFAPINRTTDNYPYGATNSTRVYMGMPYQDMDFLGFTFNGKHSYLDLGVLRTINDRVQHSLSPDMNDITADNPGGEGMYYFGSRHKSRKFSIDFAFDHLTEQQMREWKKFCSSKELSDLIFDEEPYKVYTAKITGAPILKTIPFDENGERIYKGEGTLEFTCYWPYAHTPDENTKVSEKLFADGVFGADGKSLDSYLGFYSNKDQWATVSGLQSLHNKGMNPGDIPAPFVYSLNGPVTKGTEITIDNLKIRIGQNTYNLKWDSKTGIVSGTDSNGNEATRKPIPYSGESLGGIPVGGTDKLECSTSLGDQNFFDISKIDTPFSAHWSDGTQPEGGWNINGTTFTFTLSAIYDDGILVYGKQNSDNGYIEPIALTDFCPNLKEGDIGNLSFESSDGVHILLGGITYQPNTIHKNIKFTKNLISQGISFWVPEHIESHASNIKITITKGTRNFAELQNHSLDYHYWYY